ncbi:MAG TPA: STAS domain-containing protein [Vicinamibacterales bacterium]|jgi:anti-sigma B factor antagonist|nr:STAS domain-containing protein [Vicinamibacterales bacterium]
MEITERTVDAVTILDLTGKLTIGEGAQLLKDKSESLVFQGRNRVIVNLAAVPYIDSGGLGQLVACYTTLAKAGGRLKLLNMNKKNHDLLSITKLVAVFDTFDTEREAIESYTAATST